MIDDYISRERAIKALDTALRCGAVVDYSGIEAAIDVIKDLPTAEVKPVVRGKWVWDGDTLDWEKRYFCNRCEWKTYKRSDYCPSCGADMREAQK